MGRDGTHGRAEQLLGAGRAADRAGRDGLAGARVLDLAARVRGTPNELTPDGVGYLAQRRGTYGIGTARTLLGWAPRIPLEVGMERTERWLRDQTWRTLRIAGQT